MARRRTIGIGTIALLGGAAWLLFGRKAAAIPATALPAGASEGMTVPLPGETVESYEARARAGTLPYIPALEGLGNAGGRAWYSWQMDGPSGALHSLAQGPL